MGTEIFTAYACYWKNLHDKHNNQNLINLHCPPAYLIFVLQTNSQPHLDPVFPQAECVPGITHISVCACVGVCVYMEISVCTQTVHRKLFQY